LGLGFSLFFEHINRAISLNLSLFKVHHYE